MAVAVLGTLTALALPMHTSVQQSMQRAQGRSALAQASWWLERQAALSGSYPTNLPDSAWVQDGLTYSIALGLTTGGYVLTALPLGKQSNDACGSLWLNNLGQRGATGNASGCW
jgi:Tfp pilus assembly protein PilE